MIWDADPSQVLLQSKEDLDSLQSSSTPENQENISEPNTPLLFDQEKR